MKVELFGLNEEVEIDESKIIHHDSMPDVDAGYEDVYYFDDGRIIAYDEAICSWVSLGYF